MKQFQTLLMKQEQIVQDIDLLLKFHRGYLREANFHKKQM